MRFSAPILTVMGTVAGTAAAFVAYQATASVAQTQNESSTVTPAPAPAAPVFLPCEAGWKLHGDVCVRVKKKVVVVADVPAAPATSSAVTPPSTRGSHSSDGATEAQHAADNSPEDTATEAGDDSGQDGPDSTEDSGQDSPDSPDN